MHPEDPQYQLFLFLHGGSIDGPPLKVGSLPRTVSAALGWRARDVFLTAPDAQKIRYHPQHAMDATRGLCLPMVIARGDYFQTKHRGTPFQLEVVLHEPNEPKRAYFLVVARDKNDYGIFVRTFYFTSKMSRRKMRDATPLLLQGDVRYFK